MTTYYLTDAAAAHRMKKLYDRLAAEAQRGPDGIVWPAGSDYYRLPADVQQEVSARVRLSQA